MRNTARFTRWTVAASLVAGAALAAVSVLLMPDLGGGNQERLLSVASAGTPATVSALAFVTAQLPLAVGLVGVAHLARRRVPVLASVAAVLVVVGAFGHAVYGGVNLVMLSMADDPAGLRSHAAVLDRLETGVALPFMAAGLLATVLGLVVLGVAVWRSGVGPRWAGPALLLWVVVEFAGAGLSRWAGYASATLHLVVMATLAIALWRSSLAYWLSAAEEEAPTSEAVAA